MLWRAAAKLRTEAPSSQSQYPPAARGHVIFEYTGHGRTVVGGAVTGRAYAFAGYGARAAVDERDAPSVTRASHVKRALR